ncbi:MAG TPA: hypothetical protein VNJ08_02740 [Bacteriovoracaceae bacterium]|nr:hypothetical protein [Bacteriovoracaceae bacterium]
MGDWRDAELQMIEGYEIEFSNVKSQTLAIPLIHINFDKNGHQRSAFTALEIADFVWSLVHLRNIILTGNVNENYFYVIIGPILGNSYKLVLKFNKINEILYVVTFFRLRKKTKTKKS